MKLIQQPWCCLMRARYFLFQLLSISIHVLWNLIHAHAQKWRSHQWITQISVPVRMYICYETMLELIVFAYFALTLTMASAMHLASALRVARCALRIHFNCPCERCSCCCFMHYLSPKIFPFWKCTFPCPLCSYII